jgi:hypothetical protein
MDISELGLDEGDQRRLTDRAALLGTDVAGYVRHLVRLDLQRTTWDEMAAPIREAMAGHGMTDDEVLAFFEAERTAMRAERRAASEPQKAGMAS